MRELTIGKHLFVGKKENKVVTDVRDCGTIIDVQDSRTGYFTVTTDGKGDVHKNLYTVCYKDAAKMAHGKPYTDYKNDVYTINDPTV